ncbi:MAG: MocR-like pyridoxine biosynthesis transcription factor PdxR [Alphaproteobacteria bacterium]
MRDALYHLERSKPATLQAQIRGILMAAISAGQLRAGEPVPSTRAMARRLGVSRNTVTLAYQVLVSEGFLLARERSGFYVDAQAVDGMARNPAEQTRCAAASAVEWGPRLAKQMSAQRFINRPRDWRKFPYPFIYGQVDHTIFPIAEWRDCVRQAMGKRWLDAWTVDQYTEDDPLLLEEIARRILPRRGIAARPEQILITLGAQNALYLIAALLVGRSTRVVIENPGYPDLRNMLTLRSGRIDSVPVDAGGMEVDARLAGADLVFCTPSHHYPTTVTMSLERRKSLLGAAREHDFVIVEDDYEFETNYLGTPLPALKSLDQEGRVLHVGSLSKSLMPGLRLGYVVADRRLISELRALRRLMLRHPPGNNQRAAALFMANGHYGVLVRRIHRVYHERWQVMSRELDEHFPGWSRSPGFGGSSYWLTGPDSLDAEELARRALAEGVLIEAGTPFYIDPKDGRHRFRLGFSSIPAERIGEGIRRLRAVTGAMG